MDLTQPITMRMLVLPVGCDKPALSISQPASVTITSGIPASVTITATTANYGGTGALTYQWKKGGSPVANATTSALSFPTPASGDAGTYTCSVTNTITGGTQAGAYSSECLPFTISYNSGVILSTTNAVLSVSNYVAGAQMIVENIGTPGAQYYVVTSTDVAAQMSTWTPVAGSTNTAAPVTGLWSFTVSTAEAQRFYRSVAMNPAP
jgi:hypothetical protein